MEFSYKEFNSTYEENFSTGIVAALVPPEEPFNDIQILGSFAYYRMYVLCIFSAFAFLACAYWAYDIWKYVNEPVELIQPIDGMARMLSSRILAKGKLEDLCAFVGISADTVYKERKDFWPKYDKDERFGTKDPFTAPSNKYIQLEKDESGYNTLCDIKSDIFLKKPDGASNGDAKKADGPKSGSVAVSFSKNPSAAQKPVSKVGPRSKQKTPKGVPQSKATPVSKRSKAPQPLSKAVSQPSKPADVQKNEEKKEVPTSANPAEKEEKKNEAPVMKPSAPKPEAGKKLAGGK